MYQQIIDLCKKQFGDLVLYANIDLPSDNHEHGPTLSISIDASNEDTITAFYPGFDNGKLNTWESWSNTLHLYMHSETQAHFYYQGHVSTDNNGRRYSDPVDEDGEEYIDETVFSLEVYTPEEAMEWLNFIYGFRDGSLKPETKPLVVQQLKASDLFEEPMVLLTQYANNPIPLSKVNEELDVFQLPAMYDKAFYFGKKNPSDFDFNSESERAELRAMNLEGQAELKDFGDKFKIFAEGFDDAVKPGDFIVPIGSEGIVYTWKTYSTHQNDIPSQYLLVLRPAKGNSYTALQDFLFRQPEGKMFVKKLASNKDAWSSSLNFISDLDAQQQYILRKKSGLDELKSLIYQLNQLFLAPEACLQMIDDAQSKLKECIKKNTP